MESITAVDQCFFCGKTQSHMFEIPADFFDTLPDRAVHLGGNRWLNRWHTCDAEDCQHRFKEGVSELLSSVDSLYQITPAKIALISSET